MPITKETAKALGKKGGLQRIKNIKEREQNFWDFMTSGGLRRYCELMEILSENGMIGDNQKEFMDRSEKSFPYIKAKKTDITTDGKELNPILVKFIDDDSDT